MKLIETSMCIAQPVSLFGQTPGPITVYDSVSLTPLGQSEGPATRKWPLMTCGPEWHFRFAGVNMVALPGPGGQAIWLQLWAEDHEVE